MKITIIGTGYVGLVLGAGMAEFGNDVLCIDIDSKKINALMAGTLPIYEPGLENLVKNNYREGRLKFTTDISYGIKNSNIIFIAVGTPSGEDGSADLRHVLEVSHSIGQNINSYKVIVDKSTVPVGTAYKVKKVIQEDIARRNVNFEFDVVSNPEFLKEGNAVADFMKPGRIIIGSDSVKASKIIKELYRPFVKRTETIIEMDSQSAELTKYAANCALAAKISFMNELSQICEKVGADINKVRVGIGSDKRIGYDYMYAGVGYGGSCFPKDVRALIDTAKKNDYTPKILQAVHDVNEQQKHKLSSKIIDFFNGDLSGKIIAVWGLAFKPKTDDMREAPAVTVINELRKHGAKIQAYDPVAMPNAKKILGSQNIKFVENNYAALKDADALSLITEWNLFREPDFMKMKELMKEPVIFDGRNQYNISYLRRLGFVCYGIGRK